MAEQDEEGTGDGAVARRRVIVIGPAHPYRGGIAHFNEMTIRGLVERDHTVQPITFTRQYPERLFPGKSQFAEDEAPPDDLPTAERMIDTLNPMSWWKAARRVVQEQFESVIDRLYEEYPDPTISLNFSNRLELLVAVMLSAQCTDERVNATTETLFEKYRTAADYANADEEEL